MDQEQINQLNENLAKMNESIQLMNDVLSVAIKGTGDSLENFDKDVRQSGNAIKNLSDSAKTANKAQAERDQALENSYKSAKNALSQFTDTLAFNSEKGFSKFSGALSSAGDAAFELGKSFGLLGSVIGTIIKAGTVVADTFLKQADAQNAFVTDMYKMGAVSGQSSENLTDLARQAGYSASELDKLVPSLKAAGQGLATLGKTTGEGTGTLLEMFNVGDDIEQQYFKLGYSLEELNKTQADYIELQRQSGVNLRTSGKDAKDLRKDSLEYAKNLRVLSDLTGKSAETLQQEQLAAQGAYENVIANRQAEAEIRQKQTELANETNQARRTQLEEEIAGLQNAQEARNKAIGEVANTFGQDFGEQFGRILRTGSFDQFTGQLAPLFAEAGLDPASLQKQFEGVEAGSEEFNTLMSSVVQDLRQGADESILQYGKAIQFGGEELGKALGLDKDFVLQSGIVDPELEQQRRAASRAEIDATMEAGDAQRDYAAAVETFSRDMRVSADAMLDEMNPLTGEFNALRGVTVGLATAATAATVALGAMAAFRVGKTAVNVLRGARGAAEIADDVTDVARSGSRLGRVARGAGRFVGKAALPLAIGMSLYDAYQGFNADPEATLEDRFKNAGSSTLSGLTFGLLGSDPDEIAARRASAYNQNTGIETPGTLPALADTNTNQPQVSSSNDVISNIQESTANNSTQNSTTTSTQPPSSNDTFESMLTYRLDLVIDRLNIVIGKLNDSVDIQDRILKYNM